MRAPDKNLYYSFADKTNKELIPWEGYCPVHKAVTGDMVEYVMAEHPAALVVVHPECNPEVTELADTVLSTSGMVEYVGNSPEKEFIIGTELGLVQLLERTFPDKEFYQVYNHKSCDESCVCPYMKAITLGKVRRSLEQGTHEIEVVEDVRLKAMTALERMIAIGRD
ncbi:MAG: quinolinate synthase NadA [Candidatus Woesearchaeota archaeon]|nr:quinolinate synthase NadA [Candidatus Woesearchaeota archaeon]MDP7181324.1 quinolinate synthase NadA [Candidatus Woesearchaeota archaeon]MDP7198057.1 quinolinate synthase NadA [Candidatus Woesearchaeota archaeon]MDP7466891.1 quinolinate synthase NadA [Candidatus Woesearchaeota archaeon]MDP7647326.1 quinolinate synthase NadA [Candidatus Woesearchaeota archaeon]